MMLHLRLRDTELAWCVADNLYSCAEVSIDISIAVNSVFLVFPLITISVFSCSVLNLLLYVLYIICIFPSIISMPVSC